MDVVINGVTYTPGGHSNIGVAVTTRNRPDVLAKTLEHIRQHTPGAPVIVVDDASSKPVEGADYRFDENVGIARAKNKCLELLEAAGVEHMFLFDDDTYPVVDDWWKPYVESPEPHLMYIFGDFATGAKMNDNRKVYEDSQHVAWAGPRGCMLYAQRSVLEAVGGMDPAFGKWGWEHPSWSGRINNAGLTTWRYADVVGSGDLIYSGDEHRAVTGVDKSDRTPEVLKRNEDLYQTLWHDASYIEYREKQDAVLTVLFTGQPDPQRGTRMSNKVASYATLAKSLKDETLVVLHDGIEGEPLANVEHVQVEAPLNPYFQRWVSLWQYLRDNPALGGVWCVDATDVERLQEPFGILKPGKLYVGSETKVVGDQWLRDNHLASEVQEFIEDNCDLTMLNAGLVGGDRMTVMEFLAALNRSYFENRATHLRGKGKDLGVGDMALFNMIAWSQFRDRLVYGPRINTVFKANERNAHSIWRHK